eukprot:scaffold251318_cov31-Tisochrysis_lutea.AAC.2
MFRQAQLELDVHEGCSVLLPKVLTLTHGVPATCHVQICEAVSWLLVWKLPSPARTPRAC